MAFQGQLSVEKKCSDAAAQPFAARRVRRLLIEKFAVKETLGVDSRINYLLLATALLGTFFSGTATRIVAIQCPQ